jgi:hypothetical protein
VEEWEGEVCKGKDDTFRASGDNVNTVTTVEGEGRAKIVGAVPVRVSIKTLVGHDQLNT